MDLSFYTAAAGAAAHQSRLNVIASNLSNTETTGFKSEDVIFSDLIYNELDPPALTGTQMTASSGSKIDKTNTNFKEGEFIPSDLPFDYAIMGDGFFALRNPETGQITYTRDGSFRMSLQRDGRLLLTSQDGKSVLDNQNRPIEITDENKEEMLPVGVFRFHHQNGFIHLGNNEFIPDAKNGAPVAVGERERVLFQGYLENSNVDLADEMTKLVESQRAYQYALKMVQTSDEVESTINSLRG